MTVTKSEEERVIIEVQAIFLPEGNSLMGEYHLRQVHRTTEPTISYASAGPLHVYCC